MAGVPTSPPAQAGNLLSIIGMVCGAVALLFCPILLGPAGIVLGIIGKRRGESLGTVTIAVAAAGMIIGMVIGASLAVNST
jgi:uncharacterized membrane protein